MRATLLDVAATAGLDRDRASRWLDSTDGMAEVWADQAQARNLNAARCAVRAPQRRARPDLALGPLGVRRRLAARGGANRRSHPPTSRSNGLGSRAPVAAVICAGFIVGTSRAVSPSATSRGYVPKARTCSRGPKLICKPSPTRLIRSSFPSALPMVIATGTPTAVARSTIAHPSAAPISTPT